MLNLGINMRSVHSTAHCRASRECWDKCGSVVPPVCTESANAHDGLDRALELSVHTGGPFDWKVMIVKG